MDGAMTAGELLEEEQILEAAGCLLVAAAVQEDEGRAAGVRNYTARTTVNSVRGVCGRGPRVARLSLPKG